MRWAAGQEPARRIYRVQRGLRRSVAGSRIGGAEEVA